MSKIRISNHMLATTVATVIAASVVTSGTLAWHSFDQVALNETTGLVNVGGRIHTDFNGVDKHVYVENFTDQVTGADLYVRVRLEEYMEIGEDAGEKDEALQNPNIKKLGGITTDINDVDTWDIVHLEANGTLSGSQKVRDYITITGGGQAIYMPTFNKNKDSRLGEINGTLAGPDEIDKTLDDAYEDFILYNLDGADGGLTYQTAIASYDFDSDDIEELDPVITTDEEPVEGADIYQVEETHYSKLTQSATIITMRDWMAAGSEPGPYWVFDTDGWAYWAQALEPDSATGLILDHTQVHHDLEESWYYEINARGEYATKGDWGDSGGNDQMPTGFYLEGITDNGIKLLDTIAKKSTK